MVQFSGERRACRTIGCLRKRLYRRPNSPHSESRRLAHNSRSNRQPPSMVRRVFFSFSIAKGGERPSYFGRFLLMPLLAAYPFSAVWTSLWRRSSQERERARVLCEAILGDLRNGTVMRRDMSHMRTKNSSRCGRCGSRVAGRAGAPLLVIPPRPRS